VGRYSNNEKHKKRGKYKTRKKHAKSCGGDAAGDVSGICYFLFEFGFGFLCYLLLFQ
jgi:hypothetical protein